MERANAGVKIYLLYDDVGCFWLPRAYKEPAAYGRYQHARLQPPPPLPAVPRSDAHPVPQSSQDRGAPTARRPGSAGSTSATSIWGAAKRFGRWRDTHVRIKGPAVLAADLQLPRGLAVGDGRGADRGLPTSPDVAGDQSVLIMPTGPADKLESCAIAFDDVIGQSKERLWIVSPYFVPDVSMETALYAAALRGRRRAHPDPGEAGPPHRLAREHRARVPDDRARYGRSTAIRAGSCTRRSILVDDRIGGVGTVNFDNRSFRINFEMTMWFTHERDGQRCREDAARRDFAAAKKVGLDKRGRRRAGRCAS